MRVSASLSRNGVALSTNEIKIFADQSQSLLLKAPTANSGVNSMYKLRIEGHNLPRQDGRRVGRHTQGFLHESNLDFTSTFLSITIRYTSYTLHLIINPNLVNPVNLWLTFLNSTYLSQTFLFEFFSGK